MFGLQKKLLGVFEKDAILYEVRLNRNELFINRQPKPLVSFLIKF